ncbi:hypothetical protein ACP70R_049487 [Stipagrostis hirtigluma subsp. patula]
MDRRRILRQPQTGGRQSPQEHLLLPRAVRHGHRRPIPRRRLRSRLLPRRLQRHRLRRMRRPGVQCDPATGPAPAVLQRRLLLLQSVPGLLLRRQHHRPLQRHTSLRLSFREMERQERHRRRRRRPPHRRPHPRAGGGHRGKGGQHGAQAVRHGRHGGTTNFPVVYSMAQCTPDLSAGDCLACLRRLVDMVNSTMALRMGAQIHVIRCYFRYEAYSFYDSQPMLRLGPAPAPAPTPSVLPKHKSKLWVIPIVAVHVAAAAVLCFIFYSPWFRRCRKGRRKAGSQELQGEELVLDGKNSEFSVFDFEQVLEATDNFSDDNKLGQGGFGAVYKGQFAEGLEVAVKRLASHSGQGFTEFKNEVQLIAKLQHSNLVRLLGCCSQEEEKILVYEYLPNKSLDFFIFDENKRALLDWPKLLAIIEGIAHGLTYLHKHSRLRVIHRDLKPSNILLDQELNPKISDFGLAKIFSSNNVEGNTTRRVVGTYGYMAPEYASEGIFSIKSDVFSFGVLVLEIITGKRNSGSHQCGDFINLIGYDGRWIDLVDASLVPKSHSAEMTKCIKIALLCVQENATDRPTMAEVVAMLNLSSETAMIVAEPKQPAYFNVRVGNEETSTATESCSINDVTISITTPR